MPRSLAIHFPDGQTEYWFTDAVFQPGDTLTHGDRAWVVTSVTSEAGGAEHVSMTVREPDFEGHARDVSDGSSR